MVQIYSNDMSVYLIQIHYIPIDLGNCPQWPIQLDTIVNYYFQFIQKTTSMQVFIHM